MLDDFRKIDIKWEKASENIYEQIKVMSSDETGRKLVVQVLDDGMPIKQAGVTLDLHWATDSNEFSGVESFKLVDKENSIYELYFGSELLSNIGKSKTNLELTDVEGKVTSNTFYIEVFEGADMSATQSPDETIHSIRILSGDERMATKERVVEKNLLDDFRRIDIQWEKASDKIYESIKVMSSDETGRKLVVQILDENKPIDTLNVELDLYWETESKKNRGLDKFEVIDSDNSIFEMYFTTGLLSNVGTLKSNLIIRDEKGVITSNTFYIEVLEGIDWDATQSSDSFSRLTEIMKEIESIPAQEEARVLKEAERIRSESSRVSAESTRTVSENERISKENTRKSSEVERVASESSRKLKETEREESEVSRKSAEDVRVSSEESRVLEESSRESFEEERRGSEVIREEGETARSKSEVERESNESSRELIEESRVLAETAREQFESERKIEESLRAEIESQRVINENTRISDENTRDLAEKERKESEDERTLSETGRKESEIIRDSKEGQRTASELIRTDSEDSRSANEAGRIEKELAREATIKDFEGRVLAGEFDGLDLEFEWKGTELGVRKEGVLDYTYVDLKGESGSLDNLHAINIVSALGYTPFDASEFVDTTYTPGKDIKIDVDNKISVDGELGLVENQVKKVKVDKATDADTVGGHTVAQDITLESKLTDTTYDSIDNVFIDNLMGGK